MQKQTITSNKAGNIFPWKVTHLHRLSLLLKVGKSILSCECSRYLEGKWWISDYASLPLHRLLGVFDSLRPTWAGESEIFTDCFEAAHLRRSEIPQQTLRSHCNRSWGNCFAELSSWCWEGNFRAAGIFFRYQIPCMNFFLGHSMNIF